MSLSDKTNLLVQKYIRRQYPELEEGLRRYINDLASYRCDPSLRQPAISPSQRDGAIRSVTVGPTGQGF